MRIGTEIKKVALNNNICIKELPDEQVKVIKNDILKKYIYLQSKSFLWDQFKEAAVVADSNGWKKLCSFVGSNSCLMFFDDIEDKSVILISNGNELQKLLDEMFGFEFYITNFETDYLLCFNHHDCLLGCEKKKKWIESLNK